MTYDEWIEAYIASQNGAVLGRCITAATEMNKVFPELRIVKGHVIDTFMGRRGHWWLETAGGIIVDPTASQFPSIEEYLEFSPGDLVRVGKCMQCGSEIWEAVESLDGPAIHKYVCSDACESKLRNDL
jgi:hypothetical protein